MIDECDFHVFGSLYLSLDYWAGCHVNRRGVFEIFYDVGFEDVDLAVGIEEFFFYPAALDLADNEVVMADGQFLIEEEFDGGNTFCYRGSFDVNAIFGGQASLVEFALFGWDPICEYLYRFDNVCAGDVYSKFPGSDDVCVGVAGCSDSNANL